MPILFHAKVTALHSDHGVDRVRECLGTAQAALFRLVTNHERDAVADRFSDRGDLVRLGATERIPRVENAELRADQLEVSADVAHRADFGRIDPARVHVRHGAHVDLDLL